MGRTSWTSFEALKRSFTSVNLLCHYDPTKQLILKTNASDYAITGILSHEIDKKLEPVAFFSHKMLPAKLNYLRRCQRNHPCLHWPQKPGVLYDYQATQSMTGAMVWIPSWRHDYHPLEKGSSLTTAASPQNFQTLLHPGSIWVLPQLDLIGWKYLRPSSHCWKPVHMLKTMKDSSDMVNRLVGILDDARLSNSSGAITGGQA